MNPDRIRHVVGVAALVIYGPGLFFWIIIHPLAHAWRRLGPAATYVFVVSVLAAVAAATYRQRALLLGQDFGTNWALTGVGAVGLAFIVVTGFIYGSRTQHLSTATRFGVHELSRSPDGSVLVTGGLYGVVRHPIYAYGAVAGLCLALVVNYEGTYILFAAAVPLLYVVTLLEERELASRFGDEYRQYQRQVPRFIPKRTP